MQGTRPQKKSVDLEQRALSKMASMLQCKSVASQEWRALQFLGIDGQIDDYLLWMSDVHVLCVLSVDIC